MTRTRHLPSVARVIAVLCILRTSVAFAACSSPPGIAGDIIYNNTYNTLQYCNGTNWVNAGSLGTGSGTLTAGDFCTSNGSIINCNTAYTGTGSVVLSASPTLTGIVAGAASTWTGSVAIGTTTTSGALNVNGTVTATTLTGAHTGNGSGLTGIGTASLGGITGTPSATTVLAGNGTWTSLGSAGAATGTGVANQVALWTSTTSIGTSNIYQSGSNIGIGTATASTALQINGTVTATGFAGGGASLTGIGTASFGGITGTASGTTFLAGNGTWAALTTASMPSLTNGNVWVGNASNVPTSVTPAGDVTITNTGATTVGKIAGVAVGTPTGTGNVVMSASPTLSGTITGGTFAGTHTGSGSGLTGIGTSALGGITGTASATTFLAGNGTWAAMTTAALPALTNGYVWVGNASNVAAGVLPAGDVTISNTGATTVSKIAGVAVGTPTGTGNVVMSASPTLTGTITGGTFAGTHTGNGSGLTSIGTSSLGGITGTASSTTYLRGDGVWAASSGGTVSGTANYVPVFTGTNSIGNSNIYQTAPTSPTTLTYYLTSGTSWSVPADWNNASNLIEVIGGGGGGGSTSSNGGPGASGGGGGAYSASTNVSLTPGSTLSYAIGALGPDSTSGGDTFFCNSSTNCSSITDTAVIAGAKGGGGGTSASNAAGGSGGAAASGVGSVKYSGGNGGGGTGGGGGGGAAGPSGAGVAAASATSPSASAGGAGDNRAGGAGSAGATTSGSPGSNGSEYGSYGSGGGGGGVRQTCSSGSGTASGGAGGNYGAGGGGIFTCNGITPSGGSGTKGLIRITYTPAATNLVGIGTTSPGYLLHINGTAYAVGAAGALSDIRHKKNVTALADGMLGVVSKLRPVSFEWKTPKDDGMKGIQMGFIAQEVEQVLPSVVLTQNDSEKTKGLKPAELIPVLTKAIQELEIEDEEQARRVHALELRVSELAVRKAGVNKKP